LTPSDSVFLVAVTARAAVDLVRVRSWLLQPGSGPGARNKAEAIALVIAELSTTAGRHPLDPFRKGHRQIALHDHVVSYRIRERRHGPPVVTVARIYGPGQSRP
jgi:hypothetical protein